jgi:Arc/MetJ family transcription regulator
VRVSLDIDDVLLKEAARLTGLRRKSDIVRAGLEALIAREGGRRLAALGGTQIDMRAVRRRRSRQAP